MYGIRLQCGGHCGRADHRFPRERLIAILTNVFVPCNGRFPTLITLITIFFLGAQSGLLSSLSSALMLTGVILLGILMTLLTSRLLSRTVLKGAPSSFTLGFLLPAAPDRQGDRTLILTAPCLFSAGPPRSQLPPGW